MKTKIKKLFYIVLMAIFVAGCANKESLEEAIRPVYFQKVDRNAGTEIRSFSGVAQPQDEAKLSFKVGGTIQEIAVQLGDTINEGKLIARLDATDYRINYNKAAASLKNAEVQLTTAKSAFLRIESLYAGNNASLNDYEKAKAQYESAQAMAQTANEQVSAAQNQLDYTSLEAPYSGTVSAILAKENEMTGAGHPVVAFSSIQTFEVQTAVPENIIGRINQGMEVTVQFSTLPGKTFPGIITEVSSGSPGSAAYAVIVQLSGKPSAQLFAGMTGTVNIPLKNKNRQASIIISPDAVSHDQNGDFVYLAEPTDDPGIYKATRRNVTPGELSPAGYEINTGLNTGDIVITAGIRFLYEGREVKLLNNGNANDD
jgi:RND family efflux transporter MFP subunit